MTYDATSGDIVWNLMASLANHLEDKLITNVPESYEAMLTYTDKDGVERIFMPSEVQIGRKQADPTALSDAVAKPSALVAIHAGDPEDLANGWSHSIASPVIASATNLGFTVGSVHTIGGDQKWWRRFKIELSVFFTKSQQTQAEASRIANMLRSAVEQYASTQTVANPDGWQCATVSDSLGELAREAAVAKSNLVEMGGPPTSYIYRGGLWLQVLTVKE